MPWGGSLRGFRFRGVAELLVVGLHQDLEAFTGFFPRVLGQGDVAIALRLAGVLAGLLAAAALPLALVGAAARVALDRGAGAGPRAAILFVRAFSFARIETAADVRVAEQ